MARKIDYASFSSSGEAVSFINENNLEVVSITEALTSKYSMTSTITVYYYI